MKQNETDSGVGITATLKDASSAYHLAGGGTVCVRGDKPPAGFDELVTRTSEPHAAAQLFVWVTKPEPRADPMTPPVVVPTLARRSGPDLQRIIFEYALDAMREFGAGPESFPAEMRTWVARHEARTFAEIEIATRRIVVLHHAGNVNQAAAFQLAHVA